MINLSKGQRVDIGKGLQQVGIGLGWDPNDGTGADFDLDASAFMLASSGKIPSEAHLVFYNTDKKDPATGRPISPDGAILGAEDDTTGAESDGDDDETIDITFAKIDASIAEIILVATIHDYVERKQNFGQVRNSYIRIFDAISNEEICKYELDEDFSVESAVEFGRLYRKDGGWKFEAIGRGYEGGLQTFVKKYIS